MNWVKIFNRLFEIINTEGENYFSGNRFISKAREIDSYFPNYKQYIEQRNNGGKSTSRKDYFYDILLSFDDQNRSKLIKSILDDVENTAPEKTLQLRSEMNDLTGISSPTIPRDLWNSERLNDYIQEIDIRIANHNFSSAITLAYTCLEGFLKTYVKKNIPHSECKNEITSLAKAVQSHLKQCISDYPDEAFSMLNHIAHTTNKARDQFSESHFDKEADRWLAVFIRDLVHSNIRLLLNFM